jgi:adenylate kinase family enzyme
MTQNEIYRTTEQTQELAEKASKMNIVLLGPPGSGKSTFVDNLRQLSPNVLYISTGEVTRRKIEEGGDKAEEIKRLYSSGLPWPDDFVASLVLPELLQARSRGFILDGIPRKKSETELIRKLFSENDITLNMTVNIFTDYETSLLRIEERIMREGMRPENIDHYKVRLDMYWSGIELFKRELGELARFVEIDSTANSPELIIDQFLNKVSEI